MNLADKQEICDILTRNILRAQTSLQSESEAPSHHSDASDDYIRNLKKELVDLRKLRELVEEM